MTAPMDKRVIDRIREEADMPDHISDETIARVFHGSFTAARINLGLAIGDLKAALASSLPGWVKRLIRRV